MIAVVAYVLLGLLLSILAISGMVAVVWNLPPTDGDSVIRVLIGALCLILALTISFEEWT